MRVKPVLGDWEIPRVSSIKTLERRLPSETPTRIAIAGSLYGDEGRGDFLEKIRRKYREAEPVMFAADIVAAADVQYVIIETLVFQESGIRPDQMDYLIVLKDSPPPPALSAPLASIDAKLIERASDFINSATSTLNLIDELGSAPNFGSPAQPMRDATAKIASVMGNIEGGLVPLRDIFGAME